ncbi:hypothetical protein DTL42_00650 [Bremerella cremea]|uniref:Uncharacterized protein n=2 Tax=Bremerella cremea TaxID=1031537 RepID=A0A368KXG0_9BACT|nr:hypothetical protein DTL42_00650 [Bremerella cremea]
MFVGSSFTLAADKRPWEVAPYRTLVWLDIDPSCHVDAAFTDRLSRQLEEVRYASSGSVWETTIAPSPLDLTRWYRPDADVERFVERLRANDIEPEKWDRVMLISIKRDAAWEIDFREYDSMTNSLGSHHATSVLQRELIPTETLKLVYEKFLPLTRIDNVDKKKVSLGLKGATLVEEENLGRHQQYLNAVEFIPPAEDQTIDWKKPSVVNQAEVPYPDFIPGMVGIGEAFQPVLRRNDRQGNLVKENGIMFMPWTYITCEENDGLQIRGTMVSGFNTPLPGRRNVRTQRIAIGIRPAQETTRLQLVDKSAEDVPLAGYEIYSKDPDGATLIGASNPNGYIEIPTNPASAVRLLYVRSGGNLLARLPMVPGFEPQSTARITNDSPRLLAEGFLEGWRDQLVDTMARRQILAQRVQRKIDSGDLDGAQKWLDELRTGRTVNELAFELRTFKGQFLKGNLDPTIKRRIDDLFEKGQRLVAQDKSVLIESDLSSQLEKARAKK